MIQRGVALAIVVSTATIFAATEDRVGLEISTDGTRVMVAPGHAVTPKKQKLQLDTTASVVIRDAETATVKGEQWVLPDQLADRWLPGLHLRGVTTANAIPGALIGDSVTVRDGKTVFDRGKDYVVGAEWGTVARVTTGSIDAGTTVSIDYVHALQRLDSIVLGADGKVRVIEGLPHLVCPHPPEIDEGTSGVVHLANIYRPYRANTVEPWHIFPLGEPFLEPTREQQQEMSRSVSRTLEKLRSGQPVNIVTWGDSVTVGGDASEPGLAFANLFITRLRERFPGVKITHVNAGIGGTNTDGRLPALDAEVLSHKPDLVTIEFINDMSIPEANLLKNWNDALPRIKNAGAEVIIITPHFSMPQWMPNKPHPRGDETRPGVQLLRDLAKQHNVGLADTSRRWAHLEEEGIPYITLLYNGINHPDDRGHEMFVKDLMNHFPAEP